MNAYEYPINVDELNEWIDNAVTQAREDDEASEADTIDAEEAQRDIDLVVELMDLYIENFNVEDLDPEGEPLPEWV
tara:strand:+ start:341 stop:568 length:228 start_codon:yes stop_codon:yes gene_type:complete